jgi:hypothetical protein
MIGFSVAPETVSSAASLELLVLAKSSSELRERVVRIRAPRRFFQLSAVMHDKR